MRALIALAVALAAPARGSASRGGCSSHRAGERGARERFQIVWDGPVDADDFVALIDEEDQELERAKLLGLGNSLEMVAPATAGTYAAHYAADDKTLVSMPLNVGTPRQ